MVEKLHDRGLAILTTEHKGKGTFLHKEHDLTFCLFFTSESNSIFALGKLD